MALFDLHDQPALDSPVLVVVLEGWIDSGYAASNAAQALLKGLDTFPLATFDSDSLLDHRARRPIMHLLDGVNTGLSWPGIEMRAATDLEGNDILLDVPVSVAEAILGTKGEVPTVAGERREVKVPAGTSSGAKLRLRGKGVNGADQYLVFKVVVPAGEPDEASRKLIEAYARRNPQHPRDGVAWA